MGPAKRHGPATAARTRGPGPGAFERAPGAFLATLLGKQHARRVLHYARAILSPLAPPDARRARSPRLTQTADRDDAQEPSAASQGDFHHRRAFERRLPASARRRD